MPANFTSGWLGNGEQAWHGQGIVTEGTLPAREAFEKAEALFAVEKRALTYPSFYLDEQQRPSFKHIPSGYYAVIRKDTETKLGIVSKQYEMVQNEALLRMAEFIREEVDMDSVIVLSDGAKVCFTATLRGASAEVLPGDTIKRRLVGYLGHDGKTGCGAIFTNVRVVCSNTLAVAQRSNNKVSIHHKSGANLAFNNLIESIDVARETFNNEILTFQELADASITHDDFNEFLFRVYKDTIPQEKTLSDMNVFSKLNEAYYTGMGASFAKGTLWNAVNAVTEVETSTKKGTEVQRRRKFARANFGDGLKYSQKAMKVATKMLAEVN